MSVLCIYFCSYFNNFFMLCLFSELLLKIFPIKQILSLRGTQMHYSITFHVLSTNCIICYIFGVVFKNDLVGRNKRDVLKLWLWVFQGKVYHSPQELSELNVKIIIPKICWKDANYQEALCNRHWMKSMLNFITITSLSSDEQNYI